MSGKSETSLFQQQKKIRPKIENVLLDYLSGDILNNALDFISWLRQNKMPPQWGSTNSWVVSYKKVRICYIKLKNGSWYICPTQYRVNSEGFSEIFNDFLNNVEMKELILASLKQCQHCLPCSPGKTITVFGDEMHNLCGWYTIQFCDLNAAQINDVKKVLERRIELINKGDC